MAVSTLDPRTALVVIDLQAGIMAMPTHVPSEDVAAAAGGLAAAFRAQALPVVLVRVGGVPPGRTEHPRHEGEVPADWMDLAPALDASPDDVLLVKTAWGAFTTTDLHRRLQELGVTQVVIAGIATSMGVESTARSAHEHGYSVVVATDAVTDPDPAAHAHRVERIFPALGETGTAAQITALLGRRGQEAGAR